MHLFTFSFGNAHVELYPSYDIALCYTSSVISVFTVALFKPLAFNTDLGFPALMSRLMCHSLCQCVHYVLTFCSFVGSERVQQMFPSVPVLWSTTTRGFPQLSQGRHFSVHSPLLLCYTGTSNKS